MKHLSALLFVFSFGTLFAQSWFQSGANWKYTYIPAFQPEGYVEFVLTGDESIGGKAVKAFNVTEYLYNSTTNKIEPNLRGIEYFYEDNDVIYVWDDVSFDTLFNMNASIGDRWSMAKRHYLNACSNNSHLQVIATGAKTINGVSLKYIVVDFDFGPNWSNPVTDTIIEKIGFTSQYMFPYNICDQKLDIHEGGPFRCYSDDNFSSYSHQYKGKCDFVLNVERQKNRIKLNLMPNPATEYFYVEGDVERFNIQVFDVHGAIVFQELRRSKREINISMIPNGMYLVNIVSNTGVYQERIVVRR